MSYAPEPTTTTRWGKANAWWQQQPEMDLDRWGVLTTLALYADDEGLCYPSQATIARALKRSRPWVNRVIGELADLGFIKKTARTRSSNAGTTSCEYRVISDPVEFATHTGPVTTVTPPCQHHDTPRPASDTPCHAGDTSQLKHKQNNPARPAARDPAEKNPTDLQADRQRESVPPDWTPSDETMQRARAISPDEELAAHAVMFASRSRAKGYLYAKGRIDEAWLGWLAEDRLRNHRNRKEETPNQARRPSIVSHQDIGERRFVAWAAAAAAPRVKTATQAPGRPEADNPWK